MSPTPWISVLALFVLPHPIRTPIHEFSGGDAIRNTERLACRCCRRCRSRCRCGGEQFPHLLKITLYTALFCVARLASRVQADERP